MNRNLEGIYLRVKRGGKWQSVCLSDMTQAELEENLPAERGGVAERCGEAFSDHHTADR